MGLDNPNPSNYPSPTNDPNPIHGRLALTLLKHKGEIMQSFIRAFSTNNWLARTAHFSIAICALLAPGLLQADLLRVYSSREPALLAPVFDAFHEKTGHEVEAVYLKDGLIERLKAEGERSPADLVITVDIANLQAIVDSGVTKPMTSDIIASMPAEYRDEAGEWVGLTRRARIAYASKERVKPGEITSYEQLGDANWKGRICSRSGLHNYNIALVSAFIAHHGAEATEKWLGALRGNLAKSPEGNDRAQAKAIWAGECDIALGNTYYLGLMMQDEEQSQWMDAINPLFLEFEGKGTHINLSGIALLKSSTQDALAVELVDFMLSDGQALFARLNNEYPVNPGIKPSEIVNSWGKLNPDATPLTDIASKRAEALAITQKLDFDR